MEDTTQETADTFFLKLKRFFISGNRSGCRKKNVKTKTSYRFNCCFYLLLFIFICSTFGCIMMWFTDLYLDSILNQMTLKNGTQIFEAWEKPPVKPLICVHIFNYTNMDEYARGESDKIHVNDTGPYCYRETLLKTDIKFYDNGTVSYGDRRRHKFEPKNSTGRMDDTVIVPNLPLIGAIAKMRDLPGLVQMVFGAPLETHFKATSMIKVSAHEFLFGYNDSLMSFVKQLGKIVHKELPFDKFGVLAMRAVETKDRITVTTGSKDLDRIGVVTSFNGQSRMSAWDNEECNRIDGSDGAFFPRHEINKTATLYLFHKDLCRKLPFVYEKEVNFQDGVMGMRFHAPPNLYNTTGTCFCKNGVCPPVGVFDVSPCSMGIPIMMSFPHFLNAEESVTEQFEGLHPDPVKHDFFIDIQPILGFTLGTVSRVQINIQIRKSEHISLLNEFYDETILPVVWLEVTADRLPPDLLAMIYHASVTVQMIQWLLQWGFLAICLITGSCLLFCFRQTVPIIPPPPVEVFVTRLSSV